MLDVTKEEAGGGGGGGGSIDDDSGKGCSGPVSPAGPAVFAEMAEGEPRGRRRSSSILASSALFSAGGEESKLWTVLGVVTLLDASELRFTGVNDRSPASYGNASEKTCARGDWVEAFIDSPSTFGPVDSVSGVRVCTVPLLNATEVPAVEKPSS